MRIKHLPTQYQHYSAPLGILLCVLCIGLFEHQLINVLIYDNQLIAQGEYWRLITGHFLHSNVNHLLLNGAAIILLWALHGQFYTIKSYLLLFLFCALFTSLALYQFDPNLNRYVGLSGILHGVFVYGACLDIYHREKTGYLLLVGVIIKVIHEQMFGASADLAQLIAANVAINAHLWGAIAGLIVFFILLLYSRLIQKLD